MMDWQSVYSSKQAYRAEIVKAVLIDHEIGAVIVDKKDSAYEFLGFFEVHVPRDQVMKALNIIEKDIEFE